MAKLGARPEPATSAALFAALSSKLARFSSQELSMTAWGLAQLPALPPPLLLEELEAAVQGQLPSCSAQHTATILAAFARLRHQPGERWLSEALQHCGQLAGRGTLGLVDTAQVLWALAMMGRQPGEQLLQRLLHRQVHLMGSAKQQELGQSVWALSQLRCSPGQAWLLAFEARSEALLDPEEAVCLLSLSSMLTGLARLGHAPGEGWLAKAEAAAELAAEVDDRTRRREQCSAAVQRALSHFRHGTLLDPPAGAKAEEQLTAGDEVSMPKPLSSGDSYH
jgi:hypothetical protein